MSSSFGIVLLTGLMLTTVLIVMQDKRTYEVGSTSLFLNLLITTILSAEFIRINIITILSGVGSILFLLFGISGELNKDVVPKLNTADMIYLAILCFELPQLAAIGFMSIILYFFIPAIGIFMLIYRNSNKIPMLVIFSIIHMFTISILFTEST